MKSTSLFLCSLLLLLVTGAIGRKTKEKYSQSEEVVSESFASGPSSGSSDELVRDKPYGPKVSGGSFGEEASEEISSRRSKHISRSSGGSNMEGESSYAKKKRSRFAQDVLN
ncbi:rCG32102, isoform CRA_a [Rattus norvegicus]|uniref:Seminal vesicle secretory protein 4 n=2 Tax=Rattus norvegicus TaxID=10116 RepID=A0A0G2JSZ2_RAT|nr:seminal vesicle secretory protein 4 precursor [Rattus norvegicus]AAA42193.1 seminal vesicle secretion IV [Rattus norvegicus]EDL96539.1 rCG32102, isoform CRA_a [Rattus norvegicus]|eukprot:NP_036794.1 seminal vesicle secretory protein 4 precursor [Rattus norvegicus]